MAVVETHRSPHELWLHRFDGRGRPHEPLLVDADLGDFGQYADPSVVALAAGQYAITWSAYTDAAFDVLLTRVDANGEWLEPVIVNTFREISQFHPDVAANESELVVVWEEDVDIATRNDIFSRRYDFDLNPLTDAEPVATETPMERGVTTAPWGDDFAVAWYGYSRDVTDQPARVVVEISGTPTPVGSPFGEIPEIDNPVLVPLDGDTLIVLFQTDEGAPHQVDGSTRSDRIEYAVVSAGGEVSERVPLFLDYDNLQTELSAAFDGTHVFVAWNEDPSLLAADVPELWYTRARFDPERQSLLPEPPQRIVATDVIDVGRQSRPVLAARVDSYGDGLLVWAWQDWGQTLGPGQARPDVWLRVSPTPLLLGDFAR